jgi:hypothetical protein
MQIEGGKRNLANWNGVLQTAFVPLRIQSPFEAERGFLTKVLVKYFAIVAYCY